MDFAQKETGSTGLAVAGDGAHEHILVKDIAPRTALLAGLVARL